MTASSAQKRTSPGFMICPSLARFVVYVFDKLLKAVTEATRSASVLLPLIPRTYGNEIKPEEGSEKNPSGLTISPHRLQTGYTWVMLVIPDLVWLHRAVLGDFATSLRYLSSAVSFYGTLACEGLLRPILGTPCSRWHRKFSL